MVKMNDLLMNQADFCFSSEIKGRLFYLNESACLLNAMWRMIDKHCIGVERICATLCKSQSL